MLSAYRSSRAILGSASAAYKSAVRIGELSAPRRTILTALRNQQLRVANASCLVAQPRKVAASNLHSQLHRLTLVSSARAMCSHSSSDGSSDGATSHDDANAAQSGSDTGTTGQGSDGAASSSDSSTDVTISVKQTKRTSFSRRPFTPGDVSILQSVATRL